MSISSEFREQLDDLFDKRLSDILMKVSILQQWSADNEMFADVLYQISLGWRDSPDIRYHWMEVAFSLYLFICKTHINIK
jgi:hypothetical protein